MSAIGHVTYAASWSPENSRWISSFSDILHSPYLSLCEKVTRCISQGFGNCYDYCVPKHYIIGGLRDTPEEIEEANRGWFERWEGVECSSEQALIKEAYEPIIINATTPDQIPLFGTFYRSRRTSEIDLPTILCPNPSLGGLSRNQGWDWLLKKGAKSSRPFHVITFDYACGAGQGGPLRTPKDLALNADTFFQFAQDQGIDPSRIHFFGFCTGSQVMAMLAAAHPDSGKFVSLNATDSLAKLLQEQLIEHKKSAAVQTAVNAFFARSSWAMDVREELNAIRERACFLNHAEDDFVLPSLHASNVVADPYAILLRTKPNVTFKDTTFKTHWLPLSLMQDPSTGLSATKFVVNFLLGEQVFQRGSSTERTRYTVEVFGRNLDKQKIIKEKPEK